MAIILVIISKHYRKYRYAALEGGECRLSRYIVYLYYLSLVCHLQKARYNCNLNSIQIIVESLAAIKDARLHLPASDHNKPLKFNSITGIE